MGKENKLFGVLSIILGIISVTLGIALGEGANLPTGGGITAFMSRLPM